MAHAADAIIGRLETGLGQLDDACVSLEAGLALEVRNGHHALAARTRAWWATACSRRGNPEDHALSDQLRAEAAAAAGRLGLGLVARDLAQSVDG